MPVRLLVEPVCVFIECWHPPVVALVYPSSSILLTSCCDTPVTALRPLSPRNNTLSLARHKAAAAAVHVCFDCANHVAQYCIEANILFDL